LNTALSKSINRSSAKELLLKNNQIFNIQKKEEKNHNAQMSFDNSSLNLPNSNYLH